MRAKACKRCKARKVKCDLARPCKACIDAQVECQGQVQSATRYMPPLLPSRREEVVMLAESNTIDLGQSIFGQGADDSCIAYADAIPGGLRDATHTDLFSWRQTLPHIGIAEPFLPELIDSYFNSVNWFMHAVEEFAFRSKAAYIIANDYIMQSDHNFCELLSFVVAMSAHYLSRSDQSDISSELLVAISVQGSRHAEEVFLSLTAHPDVTVVQMAILLGSFCLFNGRPNTGFAVLGSGVKIAQILSLHRKIPLPRSRTGPAMDNEQYVWWALEIFDKYAAIVFGRPTTIDDSDCDVADINPTQGMPLSETSTITTLTYHFYKCQIYRIVGPFLSRKRRSQELSTLSSIRVRLNQCYATIPSELLSAKYSVNKSEPYSIMAMQSLALSLAFNHLQTVLHRQSLLLPSHEQLPQQGSQEAIDQLVQSVLQTAGIARLDLTRLVGRTSHAGMHICTCLLTAGVTICAIISRNICPDGRGELEEGLHDILQLFSELTGLGYTMVEQSHKILCTLRDSVLLVFSEAQIASDPYRLLTDNHGDLLTSFNNQHNFGSPDINSPLSISDFWQTWPWTDL